MLIESVKIKQYRNLRNFIIDFDETQNITVVIGQNAAGKSNFIEALVLIFKYLDFDFKKVVDEELSLGFELKYICYNKKIQIEYLPNEKKKWRLTVNSEIFDQETFIAQKDELLPRYILAYYSGLGNSNRLEELFEDHKEKFARAVVKSSSLTLPEYPRMQYAELIHSQLSLFSFFIDDDPKLTKFLKDNLFIVNIQSSLLPIKEPDWARNDKMSKKDRFWGSKGVVRVLLDYLYNNVAIAPLKDVISNKSTLWKKEKKRFEVVYLYFSEFAKIKAFVKKMNWSSFDFFHVLNTANVSRLFFEEGIRIRVEKKHANKISFKQLSEGEQQLLTVLGLMRFTSGEETLFLLDEPDTHLNPYWRWRYLDFINEIVFDNQPKTPRNTTQVVMTSHDPLTIGSLKKEGVRIFSTDIETGHIKATAPNQDPKGMGVAGILTEIFHLTTTLDEKTQEQLERRRHLESKVYNSIELSPEEKTNLSFLNKELDKLGFTRIIRDPLYQKFQARFDEAVDYRKRPIRPMTPQEISDENKVIDNILKTMLDEEGI